MLQLFLVTTVTTSPNGQYSPLAKALDDAFESSCFTSPSSLSDVLLERTGYDLITRIITRIFASDQVVVSIPASICYGSRGIARVRLIR